MKTIRELYPDKEIRNGFIYFDALTAPVRISGLPWLKTNGNYRRLDDRYFDEYPEGLQMLTDCTSGAQISFKTDSKRVGIRVDGILNHRSCLPHMADNGAMGIDMYTGSGRDKHFCDVFHAQPGNTESYTGERKVWQQEKVDVTLNLPLYAGIKKLEIGLDADAVLEDPEPFTVPKPVLFYGSSITQGACACRPGMSYANILGRMFDFEVINLGFSGCARGEELIAKLIASLDLAAFIFDYDHNAQSSEELAATHELFFRIVREAHPDLPVVMVSKADMLYGEEETLRRRDIIKRTYDDARSSGDRKVWFVDGTRIYGKYGSENCTVDGAHPNDFGFRLMTEAIAPSLKEALGQ